MAAAAAPRAATAVRAARIASQTASVTSAPQTVSAPQPTSAAPQTTSAAPAAAAAPAAEARDPDISAPGPTAEAPARFEPSSPRTTVRRRAQRGSYDPEVVFGILDAGIVAHIGFLHDGHPFVIPTAYVRRDRELMIHGSPASRMLEVAAGGVPLTVCVTLLDGLVYARSAFHHSVNYRSVVVLGHAREVTDEAEKRAFLDALVDRSAPGRAQLVRPPSAKELAATRVLALAIEEVSAKIRTGGPIDDEQDMSVPVWTGQLPVGLRSMSHIPTPDDAPRFPAPNKPHGID